MHPIWIVIALFAAACGTPQAPASQSAQAPERAQLGGPPTAAGMLTAASGEIEPAARERRRLLGAHGRSGASAGLRAADARNVGEAARDHRRSVRSRHKNVAEANAMATVSDRSPMHVCSLRLSAASRTSMANRSAVAQRRAGGLEAELLSLSV